MNCRLIVVIKLLFLCTPDINPDRNELFMNIIPKMTLFDPKTLIYRPTSEWEKNNNRK